MLRHLTFPIAAAEASAVAMAFATAPATALANFHVLAALLAAAG